MITKTKRLFLTFFLCLPVYILYLRHFLAFIPNPEAIPSGFLQYDQPYYMSNAREIYDEGFSFLYSNAYTAVKEKSIYFQPQIFLLGTIHHFTNWNPGYIFAGFGLVFVFLAIWMLTHLYERLFGLNSSIDVAGLFIIGWGGGMINIVGFIVHFLKGESLIESIKLIYEFDPFGGAWLLNYLRSLIYPLEAYYHFLTISIAYFAVGKQYTKMLLLVFLLSLSHPFTGIEFILIHGTFLFCEKFFIQNPSIKFTWIVGLFLIFCYHVGYYIVFLGQFPDHRIVKDQWELAWNLDFKTIFLSYATFMPIILWAVSTKSKFKSFFSNQNNRYFFIWFAIVFLLSNHDMFTAKLGARPVQPLHFTRGHDVFALSLLAMPFLLAFFKSLKHQLKWVIIGGVVSIYLIDNMLFFTEQIYSEPWRINHHLTKDEKLTYDFLNKIDHGSTRPILISEDIRIGYWATTYTPYRSWLSHYHCTPMSLIRLDEKNAFYIQGQVLNSNWYQLPLIFIVSKKNHPSELAGLKQFKPEKTTQIYENTSYRLYRYLP